MKAVVSVGPARTMATASWNQRINIETRAADVSTNRRTKDRDHIGLAEENNSHEKMKQHLQHLRKK
jgi:hypothetical protein